MDSPQSNFQQDTDMSITAQPISVAVDHETQYLVVNGQRLYCVDGVFGKTLAEAKYLAGCRANFAKKQAERYSRIDDQLHALTQLRLPIISVVSTLEGNRSTVGECSYKIFLSDQQAKLKALKGVDPESGKSVAIVPGQCNLCTAPIAAWFSKCIDCLNDDQLSSLMEKLGLEESTVGAAAAVPVTATTTTVAAPKAVKKAYTKAPAVKATGYRATRLTENTVNCAKCHKPKAADKTPSCWELCPKCNDLAKKSSK